MYDKGVERGTHAPGQKWRIELEAKGSLARTITEDLCGSQDATKRCWQLVRSSWVRAGYSWPVRERSALLPKLAREPEPESSAVSLMNWLRTSVRPTMPRVLSSYSFPELMEALGLTEQLQLHVSKGGNHDP